ncbi:hypothetical protein IWW34DRAFT_814610 [Fusarium oxysporum f. sp. albedinis]|nr:uncharacterized protein FOBCDRAFT_247167 [Fusarium oxysporum Fo47]KAI3586154.1 hypothetical protein IWW34DRAFT_814610 [Fusarium oxysporum f. sp. albedinis]RKK28217.1 hypothetical protein BFJ65_g166 [Fusarium oxysporum f. sp. cepae]RKL09303.1 hypothetical protein BFJ71_g1167 [Fusarium oxysporum]RYC96802.1 hypothetical protein BFJ63_vAg659 [Fusarium oxysporum f. sp. narcissi]QKD47997.1 hypothetical protein FOBCDRAFT_247167 [Fusarium oxysporum Fo47]
MNGISAPGEPQVVRNGLQSPPINTSKDMASRLASKPHDAQPNYDVMSTGSNMVLGAYSPSSQGTIQDCITVAPRHPKAHMARGSSSAALRRGEDGPKYDLTTLANPIRPTSGPRVPMFNLEQVYDIFNDTRWGNQQSDAVGEQNPTERRQNNKTAQSRASKQTKRNPLGPRAGSGVSKTPRLHKQPGTQLKRSKNPRGKNPIDVVARGASSTPSSPSDPAPYYEVARAPNLSRPIPDFDPALISTCPKPLSPSEMLDGEKFFLYQMATARHLAFNGVSGPYQIGHCLCDVHKATGNLVKFARACTAPNGERYWRHLMTNASIKAQDGSRMAGKPVALSNGALVWMADEEGKIIAPEWTFNEPQFLPGSSDDQEMGQYPKQAQQGTNPIHPGLKTTSKDPFWW